MQLFTSIYDFWFFDIYVVFGLLILAHLINGEILAQAILIPPPYTTITTTNYSVAFLFSSYCISLHYLIEIDFCLINEMLLHTT